jgi:hypothetical protein
MTTYYIYKIYCNDDNVTDTYIGSTSNIASRKYNHKSRCNTQNKNLKVYEIIRANGGWNNWSFVVIEEIKECSKIQAHIREEYHRQELKANMNSQTCFSGITDYNTKEEQKIKYNKQYREKNKEHINKKIICECGNKFSHNDKSRHFKSKKHQNYLSTLKEPNL